jgi:hypothetical protein
LVPLLEHARPTLLHASPPVSDREVGAANQLRAAVLQRVLHTRGLPSELDESELPRLKGRMQAVYAQRRNDYSKGVEPDVRSMRVVAYLYLIWALLFLVLAQLSRQ